MKYKCLKCNNKFSSEYLLNKHMNKKTPCTTKIKCNLCGLEFKSEIYLERHKNRKTPCIKSLEHSIQVPIIINNKEKENTRLKIEKEKTKQLELKLQLKIKEKEMEIQAQKELKMLEIEALKLRNESRIKEEEMKTERKEKTTHVINNIETINIQNNFIQQINMKYVTDKVLCLETKNFDKIVDVIYKRKIEQENEFNIYLFNNSKSIRDFISTFLKMIFNTEKFINMKCLFYNKELDKFFGIFQNPETKEVRQIDYEKYIDCLFRPILLELFKNIEEYCKETKENINPNDDGYTKYIDITSGRSVTLNSLENMSKDILYDGYILSKDDYDQIIVKYNKGIKLNV